MALWAFHNNPGIGGFGESNPILFGGAKIHTKKRSTIPSPSSNRKNNFQASESSDGRSSDRNPACPANHEYSVGKGDLICQIVKELVDNAVDACRSPISESEDLQIETSLQNQMKRIRVDIRPFSDTEAFDDDASVGSCRDEVLQLTVTDTGCGMENIQGCVNAFQSSKGGGDPMNQKSSNNATADGISSGRYGIGLTLCLLHAQRCVPNSRASISSATPQSKHLTRAFFEVDKPQDSVKCVQEEVVNFTTAPTESGTCVSLLIPGGAAAKLAWPRLKDYFARFGLCTKLCFELDVFAPTLSKLPIFIRPRQLGKHKLGDESSVEQQDSAIQLSRDGPKSDQWEDLLDGDGTEEETDSKTETLSDEKETSSDCSNENERHEFTSAVQSFWPDCNIVFENVARSVHNIRNFNDETTPFVGEEAQRRSVAQLEVSMAVCPDLDHDEKSDSGADSLASIPNDLPSGNAKTATLQLVRIVNDVPIIENAEAHSCGLVHGTANKRIWGSFGLDIERSATVAPDSGVSTPSFLLRDSGLVAPFINKNGNHKQLEADDFGTNHEQSYESNRKRRTMGGSPPRDLSPANVRVGTILLVVNVRANPSSLPLPTLSKGRLPLNHLPIDEALQLGLRDCLVSLQSTSRGLFLTSSQLRTAERDVRYVPAIASAASRIICRSRNRLLRSKCLGFFPNESTEKNKHLQESTSTVEEKDEGTNLNVPALANALESRLRLAIQARDELVSRKRSKRQKGSNSCCHVTDEEFEDFDSERGGEESFRVSVSDKSDSLSSSLAREKAKPQLENTWTSSLDSESFQALPTRQQFEDYSCEAHDELPITEIVIENYSTQSTNEEEEEESFADWL